MMTRATGAPAGCQVPIRVRLLGEPGEDDLAELEAAVARAVTARLAQAARLRDGQGWAGATRHPSAAAPAPPSAPRSGIAAPWRDQPAAGLYELPSFQLPPETVRVPVGTQGRPDTAAALVPGGPGDGADPISGNGYPGYGFWPLPEELELEPGVDEAADAVGRWFPRLLPLLLDSTPRAYRLLDGDHDRYWALRHPSAGVVARVRIGRPVTGLLPERTRPLVPAVYHVDVFVSDEVGDTLRRLRLGIGLGPGQAAGLRGARPPAPERSGDPLFVAYLRRFPPKPGQEGIADPGDTAWRIQFALGLSDRGFWGSVYEAAMEAIADPWFIVSTAGLIGIYVGLWLVPDPSAVTKVLATGLTVLMLALFTWTDLIGLARVWFQLDKDAVAATSEEQLRAAGNQFMRKLGQVGFDVFLMLLFLLGTRAVRGKLSGARARIAAEARARAEARVREAAEAPGSGARLRGQATPAELSALADARAAAGEGARPGAVLDQLASRLPDGARRGLAADRARAGDAQTLRVLEGRARGGQELFRFLEEKGLDQAAKDAAADAYIGARARLARARLIELRSFEGNPALRRTIRAELFANLVELGRALVRRGGRLRDAVADKSVERVVGDLGEALARGQLAAGLPPGRGLRVLSSLELARKVPGYRTLAEWARGERAAGREPPPRSQRVPGRTYPPSRLGRMRQGPDGIYESVGQIDNAIARQLPGGRWRILEIEEVKTGTDTPTSAREQVTSARDHLARIAAGQTDVRVFERPTPSTVGRDLTGRLDLSQGSRIRASTRGPEVTEVTRRGPAGSEPRFDRSLAASRQDLTRAARRLIAEGVPPEPPSAVRLIKSSGEPRDRESAPDGGVPAPPDAGTPAPPDAGSPAEPGGGAP
jgi:hypothetical protein